MNRIGYTFLLIMCVWILSSKISYADSTQTNASGSNTAIEGGYTSTSTTNYADGSSSNTTATTSNSSTSNTKSAPFTAAAPSMNTSNNCALSLSAGVQNFSIGASVGRSYQDETCELIALSTALSRVGMKVASIALLCQDERVWKAFISAGTPCPTDGAIGKESLKLIAEKYNYKMPTYKKWVELERLKVKNNKKITITKIK
jgi:hypothetical protein|tara:strand:+ start:182 stop:787 length:606 start_codon:yes stop_codon:yes gene_type:complete